MGRTRIDTAIVRTPALGIGTSDALALDDVARLATTPDGAREIARRINDRYQRLERDGYDIGAALNAANAANAHKSAGYARWADFVEAELRIPKTTAWRFQSIALSFTREQFVELGQTRSAILVRLPEPQRRALLPEAKTLSTRALEAKVAAEIASADGAPQPDTTPRPRARSVKLREGSVEIPVAKVGVDGGFAVLEGLNGSAITLVIGKNEKGELLLHLHARGANAESA